MSDLELLKEKMRMILTKLEDEMRKVYMSAVEFLENIKKSIGIMVLLCIIAPHLHASIFDGIYKKVDDNSTKNYNATVKVADEVSAVKNLSVQAIGKIDRLGINLKANAQAQASAIAGVGNKVQNTTSNVGRDQKTSTVNDSAIFTRYVESQEKLAKVYEKIIIVLIGQLCALLTLFIRKDEKATTALIKLIADDSEREDNARRTVETKTTAETLPLSEKEKEIKSKGGNV